MSEIRPCVDFLITQKCNYRCEYCSQSKKFADILEEADDKTIDAFLKFIKTLDKDFEITISGGEPLCHQRFFDVIDEIKKTGLKLSVVSNFSHGEEKYKKIIDIAGENLVELFVSFHSTQVKDFDAFLNKLENINSYKNPATSFCVASVVTDENIETLKKLEEFSKSQGIKFCPQHMRVKNSYVAYKKEAEEFISKYKGNEPGQIIKTFGKMCHAGSKFLVIYQNGEAYRCYSSRFNRGHILGNIKDKNFKMFNAAKPCLNAKCTCPKPIGRNMLEIDRSDFKTARFMACINFLFLPFYVCKNFKVIRQKLVQGSFLKKRFK